MPAPPMPAIQIRLPASGCELDELIRDPLCGVGPGGSLHGRSHPYEPRLVAEELLDDERNLVNSRVVDDDGAARVDEVLRVRALMVARRIRVRDEHRRPP